MTRNSALFALVLGAAISSPAHAQSDWSEFGAAFQLLPCNDGWAGCRVDGEPIQPDLLADSDSMPTPAHMRVGWFDLKATVAFSPFGELSEYTGELPYQSTDAAADADADAFEEPEEIVAEAPSDEDIEAEMSEEDRAAVAAAAEAAEAERLAQEESAAAAAAAEQAMREQEARARAEAEAQRKAEEARRRQQELERQRREAEAKAASDAAAAAEAERLRKEAEAARKAAEEAERQRKAEEAARKAAEEERKRKEAEAKRKAEEEARKRAEAEAKRKAEEEARARAEAEAKRKAEEEAERKRQEAEAARKAEEERRRQEEEARKAAEADGAAEAAAVAPAEAAPPPGSCGLDELVRLEPQAMLGKLNDGQIAACEQTLADAAKMTDKSKVSLLLQVNAFSKGDKATWEKLVKRHLNEIDQSNPDLCYKYALHLSKKGAGRASGVIRWADVALENRIVWTGDTYTSRVFSLYKLRAVAAQKLWQSAEAKHAEAPSDETNRKVDKHRAMTKVMAREWYEYAKVSGKDTTKALQLCMSAAGTKDYCEAG